MNIDEKLTENRVQTMLMRSRYRRHWCLPNYTPFKWWENDVFMITSSGYWWEFEIKLTRADLRRDAKKENTRRVWCNGAAGSKTRNKHELMATTDEGPTCFYYVAPRGVIPHEEIPEWAGLIEFEASGNYLMEKEPAIKAPRRHRDKVSDKQTQDIFKNCYWRYHNGRSN